MTKKKRLFRSQENEITKAYEFICVVSVKPMCCRPKFSKPHIYQGSIDCKSRVELFIRNDHPNVCWLAFARIANDCLTTHIVYDIYLYTISRRPIRAISLRGWLFDPFAFDKWKYKKKPFDSNWPQSDIEKEWVADPQSTMLRYCRCRFVGLYAQCHHKI